LQPTGPPTAPGARLDAHFDAIRNEFEGLSREAELLRGQRDEYDSKGMFFTISGHFPIGMRWHAPF
jgi:hypothetical protein